MILALIYKNEVIRKDLNENVYEDWFILSKHVPFWISFIGDDGVQKFKTVLKDNCFAITDKNKHNFPEFFI